jgi:PHP family Zn ribbon phosphoesterase
LGIKFNCCSVYNRIYINRAGTHYEGACPKCGRKIKIGIDPGRGVSSRFFETK